MHMRKNLYGERESSQLPALQLLEYIGYEYISPEQATKLRDNFHNPLLMTVLREQLRKLNRYEYKDEYHSFSEENIEKAVRDIDIPLTEGLVSTNEKIYDLLMLGKS